MSADDAEPMSFPNCAQCEHGKITLHSSTDKCLHENNLDAHGQPLSHPVALRQDAALCGPIASWFTPKDQP